MHAFCSSYKEKFWYIFCSSHFRSQNSQKFSQFSEYECNYKHLYWESSLQFGYFEKVEQMRVIKAYFTTWSTLVADFCPTQTTRLNLERFSGFYYSVFCFEQIKSWLVIQNFTTGLIRMFVSSNQLFVSYSSRRILRIVSARNIAAICRKKLSHDWLKKDNEKASLVHNL